MRLARAGEREVHCREVYTGARRRRDRIPAIMKYAVGLTLLLLLPATTNARTERQKKLAAAFPEIAKLFDAAVERDHLRGAAIDFAEPPV